MITCSFSFLSRSFIQRHTWATLPRGEGFDEPVWRWGTSAYISDGANEVKFQGLVQSKTLWLILTQQILKFVLFQSLAVSGFRILRQRRFFLSTKCIRVVWLPSLDHNVSMREGHLSCDPVVQRWCCMGHIVFLCFPVIGQAPRCASLPVINVQDTGQSLLVPLQHNFFDAPKDTIWCHISFFVVSARIQVLTKSGLELLESFFRQFVLASPPDRAWLLLATPRCRLETAQIVGRASLCGGGFCWFGFLGDFWCFYVWPY